MYLFISPHDLAYAVFGLVQEVNGVAEGEKIKKVETRPEQILEHLLQYLQEVSIDPCDLEGVIVVTGPGSFTALRAGVSVVNTFAFVHEKPLISVPNKELKDISELLKEVDFTKLNTFVTPFYGREPNITKPKV